MVALAAALFDERARAATNGTLRHWRSSGPAASPLLLVCGEAKTAMETTYVGERRCRVNWAGHTIEVEIVALADCRVRFLADGLGETAYFAWDDETLHLSLDGATARFQNVLLTGRGAAAGADAGAALAPMTGTIAAVRIKPGDAVRKGQCLVILEAMKMEHEILAPRDGTVAAVLVTPGEQVMTRKLLVELAPPDSA